MLGKLIHRHPCLQPREGLVLLALLGLVASALALLLATSTTRLALTLGPPGQWEGVLLPKAFSKHTSTPGTCVTSTERTRTAIPARCLLSRARFLEGMVRLLVPDMTAAADQARLFVSLDTQGTGALSYGDLAEAEASTGEGRFLGQVRRWREVRRQRALGHLNVYGDGLDPLP
jgi:hypothetical protein